MTAFGPYKNTEVIDFTELNEHDLFVISGNTGAGKTTIFDGISFALYGTASGQDRGEIRMLRSDFADDDVHTAVELEFLLKGKHYRIRRQLGHVKKGNKSKTGDYIEFFEKDGEEEIPCVDRQIVSEVNERMEEIIGLSQDQFKQIVMLPQGEFRKLLTSDTENKEAILRRLFKTENYKAINEVLKGKRSTAEVDYKQQVEMRKEYIRRISSALPIRSESLMSEVFAAEYFNTDQVLTALNEEIIFYEKRILADEEKYIQAYDWHEQRQKEYHQAEHINHRFLQLQEKNSQLTELTEEKEVYEQKEKQLAAAERANSIYMYEHAHERAVKDEELKTQQQQGAEKQLVSVSEKYEKAEVNYEYEENRKTEREQASRKLERLQEFLPIVQGIEAKKKELKQLEEKANRIKKKYEETQRNIERLEKQNQNNREEIVTLDKQLEQLSEKPLQLMKLENQARVYQRYMKLKQELQKMNQVLKVKQKAYKQMKEMYALKEASWLSNRAVVLAHHLHDGKPCPVCGSTEHPDKATPSGEDTTQEELAAAKQELEREEKEFNRASSQLEAKKEQYAEAEMEIKQYTTKLEQIEIEFSDLVAAGKQMRADAAKYEKAKEQLKILKKTEEKALNEKTALAPVYQQLMEEYQQLKQDYLTEQAILKERISKIPEDLTVLAELQKQITAASQKKRDLEKAWETAKQTFQEVKEEYTKAEANLGHLTRQLEEVKIKRMDAYKEFQEKLEEQQFASDAVYFDAKLQPDEQKQLKALLDAYKQQVALLTEQAATLETELEGKKQINLEQLRKELEEWKVKYEAALQQFNQSAKNLEEAKELQDKITKAEKNVQEKEKYLSLITDVHDTLRGQNSKKISFERYLQMEYLEQIIHSANQRLQKLSNNQYYLTRSDRQESHGKQSGLALDVYDSHTGQTRDVKSLSGGEKFHAALSLALGMSDVIQSFQGNISIDTMFIDEGFGSLDEEALTKAIDALIEIMESGRIIGVISHVKELKEMFPAILEVKKTREGHSEARFILK